MDQITLCLSGGGARGMAHIGVVKYLTESGIQIKAISGTSAGALVGAFVCDGYHPDEITDIIKTQLKSPAYNYWHLKEGLINVDFYKTVLERNLRARLIENLSIPFFANATNYINGETQTFDAGPVIPAIMASSAIPIVFPTVMIENTPYVDGGLACNLNTTPLKKFNQKIVGVHVNPLLPYDPAAGLYHQIERLYKLSIRTGAINNMKDCSVLIEPKQLEQFEVLEVKSFDKIIEIGYSSAKEMLERLSSP